MAFIIPSIPSNHQLSKPIHMVAFVMDGIPIQPLSTQSPETITASSSSSSSNYLFSSNQNLQLGHSTSPIVTSINEWVLNSPETSATTTSPKDYISPFAESSTWISSAAPSETTSSTTPPTPPTPPTKDEITLLRSALGAYYAERNPIKAEELLSKAIVAWERQNPDEKASLYRIRADCYMELRQPENAIPDYTKTIELLNSPGGELADPSELPSAHIGRARAIRSTPPPSQQQQQQSTTETISYNNKIMAKLTPEQADQSSKDYETYLELTGDASDYADSLTEKIQEGAKRNPYAAWEWGASLRSKGEFMNAYEARKMAAEYFDSIGDKPRSVIAELDGAIDYAMWFVSSLKSTSPKPTVEDVRKGLESAIEKTTKVESRDVKLLQRVIAKEGEARVALASILWDTPGGKGMAEKELGECCLRLEQLDVDDRQRGVVAAASNNKNMNTKEDLKQQRILPGFTIDDSVGAGEISCSRLKNEKFLTESLGWSDALQAKAMKLQKLDRN